MNNYIELVREQLLRHVNPSPSMLYDEMIAAFQDIIPQSDGKLLSSSSVNTLAHVYVCRLGTGLRSRCVVQALLPHQQSCLRRRASLYVDATRALALPG